MLTNKIHIRRLSGFVAYSKMHYVQTLYWKKNRNFKLSYLLKYRHIVISTPIVMFSTCTKIAWRNENLYFEVMMQKYHERKSLLNQSKPDLKET